MLLFHTFCCFAAGAITLVLGEWTIWKLITSSFRLLPQTAEKELPAYWEYGGGALLIALLALPVVAMLAVIFAFPDVARFAHWQQKLFGYDVCRITMEFSSPLPENRVHIVWQLDAALNGTNRTIRYRVPSSRSGNQVRIESDVVPAYFQWQGQRLIFVTGGALPRANIDRFLDMMADEVAEADEQRREPAAPGNAVGRVKRLIAGRPVWPGRSLPRVKSFHFEENVTFSPWYAEDTFHPFFEQRNETGNAFRPASPG